MFQIISFSINLFSPYTRLIIFPALCYLCINLSSFGTHLYLLSKFLNSSCAKNNLKFCREASEECCVCSNNLLLSISGWNLTRFWHRSSLQFIHENSSGENIVSYDPGFRPAISAGPRLSGNVRYFRLVIPFFMLQQWGNVVKRRVRNHRHNFWPCVTQ